MRDRAREQLEARRLRRRRPLARRGGDRRVQEHHRHQIRRGDAVDHAVMDLRQQRPASVAQALDGPQLPQRLVAVEALREDATGHLAQLLLGPGLRDGGVAEVVVEAEVGIVDPRGRADPERNVADLLPVARHQLELARDHRAQILKRRRRPLEDADGADVHRRGGVLHVQEGRVDRTHPLHATSVAPSSSCSSTR
jgi:hypothetical protein